MNGGYECFGDVFSLWATLRAGAGKKRADHSGSKWTNERGCPGGPIPHNHRRCGSFAGDASHAGEPTAQDPRNAQSTSAERHAGDRTSAIAHSSHSSRAATVRMPPSRAIRNVRAFRFVPVGSARMRSNSSRTPRQYARSSSRRPAGLVGLEHPEEERPQRGIAPNAAIRLRLPEPTPDLLEAVRRDRVCPRASGAGLALLDQPVLAEPCQLGVDLAVACRPRVREGLLEVLEQCIAAAGLIRERSEEGVAK